jgi:hypothetical protein
MQKRYGLVFINGNRSIAEIGTELQKKIDDLNFRSLDDTNELGLIGRKTLPGRKQELNQKIMILLDSCVLFLCRSNNASYSYKIGRKNCLHFFLVANEEEIRYFMPQR